MTCSKCAALSRTCFEYTQHQLHARAHIHCPIHKYGHAKLADCTICSLLSVCNCTLMCIRMYTIGTRKHIDWSSGHFDSEKEEKTAMFPTLQNDDSLFVGLFFFFGLQDDMLTTPPPLCGTFAQSIKEKKSNTE